MGAAIAVLASSVRTEAVTPQPMLPTKTKGNEKALICGF
ncbi:hypothetical protein GP5015_859 [gamma proteobacterium HTCC5015]|nr:hypothetical protein GP5015_859 [gamma proteobacterium HTCC5015]